eukprot:TRINITY_DN47161_c0_g1_i1.p2 TRINITY_DN47161_c0_g1~~TRINITY_DN47161_c0_g1_i1.p2  ORF type:complete len:328 (-),score=11.29 TRINITY_DN47161_c0_g1_i1:172-1155(-)
MPESCAYVSADRGIACRAATAQDTPYCWDHKCAVKGCFGGKPSSRRFCEKHVDVLQTKVRTLARTHDTEAMCAHGPCHRPACEGKYCSHHTCPTCKGIKRSGWRYCAESHCAKHPHHERAKCGHGPCEHHADPHSSYCHFHTCPACGSLKRSGWTYCGESQCRRTPPVAATLSQPQHQHHQQPPSRENTVTNTDGYGDGGDGGASGNAQAAADEYAALEMWDQQWRSMQGEPLPRPPPDQWDDDWCWPPPPPPTEGQQLPPRPYWWRGPWPPIVPPPGWPRGWSWPPPLDLDWSRGIPPRPEGWIGQWPPPPPPGAPPMDMGPQGFQ